MKVITGETTIDDTDTVTSIMKSSTIAANGHERIFNNTPMITKVAIAMTIAA